MTPDNRTDEEVKASFVTNLIRDGMPVDLAPEAVEHWLRLLGDSRSMTGSLIESLPEVIFKWCQYCFMQGFVAGHTHAKSKTN